MQPYNKCRTRYTGLRLWARHINEVGILFKTSKGLRLCGSSSCYITDDVRCFEESCWSSWHNWKALGCWLYFCCFFLLKSRRDSTSCTSWAGISRRSRWTFFSPKGRPWVHCVRILAKTWLHLLLPTNRHLIDIYVTICATLCKALHLCFVAKIHCKKCMHPRSSNHHP